MIGLDNTIAEAYLAESNEHLAAVEADLLALEKGGEAIDEEIVDRAFRAVHTVRGGASLFDLVKIRELAQESENLLALIRARKMLPTSARVSVLLLATDRLHEMIQNPGTSNQTDNSEILAALDRVRAYPPRTWKNAGASVVREDPHGTPGPRMLLVEDDFASRLLLQTFLSRYGECHVAVNGREAVEAFRSATEAGRAYNLICMDIMMPEMDGREAVRRVRLMEEARGIVSTAGVKIIMTTTVRDIGEVIQCFRELCDAYLMKPIDLGELLSQMKSYRLIP